MKYEVKDWAKFDENGLLEIQVDEFVVQEIIQRFEDWISDAINEERNYDKARTLINKREKFVKKMFDYANATIGIREIRETE